MKRNIELLAPGGDIDSIKAAILAGADAIYCGLDKFNARNRATNITIDDLNGIVHLAHKHNCQIFITLNIIIVESEWNALFTLLNKLVNTRIDGIIVQDLGLFYILSRHFSSLSIHASTQLTTHNEGQILFLQKLNATRVNLSRELSITEIKQLTVVAHANNVLVEVFVHGSNCICFSGLCYISSVQSGNSGNRGRCSQPCRDQYIKTNVGADFPLNLKDNSAYENLIELNEAGVDSLKIEGRIKKFHYVYTIVDAWRKQLNNLYSNNNISRDKSILYKVFNRDFSNSFLSGDISKEMYIDNPRDNSAIYLSKQTGAITSENLDKAKGNVYDERTTIINQVEQKIDKLSVAKPPLSMTVNGIEGFPLSIELKTPYASKTFYSESILTTNNTPPLSYFFIQSRFKALNETEYYIEKIDTTQLQYGLFLPFKEIKALKLQMIRFLRDSHDFVEPKAVPSILNERNDNLKPTVSILLSSYSDYLEIKETTTQIYYELPNSIHYELENLIELFTTNRDLIPWFPSVLIGDDYSAAIKFISIIQPLKIVTNNTGVAYEAYKKGIKWIAGPQLNVVNSFSLICLKEEFNCSGAFISNEINRIQLKGIKKPANFDLYYSIYHPIILMTSRQCLMHQVEGCIKNSMDKTCLPNCIKHSSIKNLKEETFILDKSAGNYHSIYNAVNYLNTEIITDIPQLFTSYFIDLRDIKTNTKINLSKKEIVQCFQSIVEEKIEMNDYLTQNIYPTTNEQYRKGI